MKFTATELYKQGLQLANADNTNFLTHNEITNYLNDAFQSIYSEVVNQNDLYWLREAIGVKSSSNNDYVEYYLPFDFFSMRTVKTINGVNIPRKAATAKYGLSYDIINGRLRIYGGASGIKIEYFPNPTTITIPFKTFKVENVELSGNKWDSFGDYFISINNNIITAIDVSTNDILCTIQIEGGEVKEIHAGADLFVVKTEIESEIEYAVYNYEGTQIAEIENAISILEDERGVLYSLKKDDNKYSIYSLSGVKILEFESEMEIEAKSGVFFREQEYPILFIDNKFYNVYRNEWIDFDLQLNNVRYCKGIDSPFAILGDFGNTLYCVELNPDNTTAISTHPIEGLMLLAYSNDAVYITKNGFDIWVQDWRSETTFNYPNNIFYRAIASMIATFIISKQGGDLSIISNLASGYMNQLSKFLNSNTSYGRINNAYY